MKKRFVRLLSLCLVFFLLMGVVPQQVYAEVGSNGETNGTEDSLNIFPDGRVVPKNIDLVDLFD